jgi:DNA-binding NtrC family response regulator
LKGTRPEQGDNSTAEAAWIAQGEFKMNSVKVLCVENQMEYLDALTYMLEASGFEVVPATTGRQGISMLTRHSVQGVLLEYDLPDASGASVRAEMKRIKPEIPVLLFTGVGSQTPFLLRFFDAYLRSGDKPEEAFQDLDA